MANAACLAAVPLPWWPEEPVCYCPRSVACLRLPGRRTGPGGQDLVQGEQSLPALAAFTWTGKRCPSEEAKVPSPHKAVAGRWWWCSRRRRWRR